ncbi:hypothetical protein ACFO0J_11185 [Castellaniella hirudinis]|uniref:Transposase n=2 Tax=Castellaniella TaxID=359336 RepID=A0ABV8S2A0_9BURK
MHQTMVLFVAMRKKEWLAGPGEEIMYFYFLFLINKLLDISNNLLQLIDFKGSERNPRCHA